MTCLSHDLASYQERESEGLNNYTDIQQVKRRFSIDYDLLLSTSAIKPALDHSSISFQGKTIKEPLSSEHKQN